MNEGKKPYRTIFVGTLTQETAMCVGGTESVEPFDATCARDGKGDLTIRGRAVAGALVATARKLVRRLPECISAGLPGRSGTRERGLERSCWMPDSAHAGYNASLGARVGVAIRHDTRTHRQHALYDREIVARGTTWNFLMQVDALRASAVSFDAVEWLTARVLAEWQAGRCWLGHDVARGLGWMRLQGLKIYRLTTGDVDVWPNAMMTDTTREAYLESRLSHRLESHADQRLAPPRSIDDVPPALRPDWAPWTYGHLGAEIVLEAPKRDSFGCDALGHGGHPGAFVDEAELVKRLLRPRDIGDSRLAGSFAPDALPLLDEAGNPMIAGSALRGALRHAHARLARQRGYHVLDPSAQRRYGRRGVEPRTPMAGDPTTEIFGDSDEPSGASARLLIADAHLRSDSSQWKGAWIQSHAEDEFSAGAFAGAKFDRVVIVPNVEGNTVWKCRGVLEATRKGTVLRDLIALRSLQPLLEKGHVPIGGGQFAGHGWLPWTRLEASLHTAGEATLALQTTQEGAKP